MCSYIGRFVFVVRELMENLSTSGEIPGASPGDLRGLKEICGNPWGSLDPWEFPGAPLEMPGDPGGIPGGSGGNPGKSP